MSDSSSLVSSIFRFTTVSDSSSVVSSIFRFTTVSDSSSVVSCTLGSLYSGVIL